MQLASLDLAPGSPCWAASRARDDHARESAESRCPAAGPAAVHEKLRVAAGVDSEVDIAGRVGASAAVRELARDRRIEVSIEPPLSAAWVDAVLFELHEQLQGVDDPGEVLVTRLRQLKDPALELVEHGKLFGIGRAGCCRAEDRPLAFRLRAGMEGPARPRRDLTLR